MTFLKTSLFGCALWACVAGAPVNAASSTASLAANSASTSVGSVSDSFGQSSNSSGGTKTAAAGDYKVVALAAAPERPGFARITLQALAQDNQPVLDLYLPQAALEQSQLTMGDTVTAQERPYGLAFANSQTRQEFFLVLNEASLKELKTQAVSL